MKKRILCSIMILLMPIISLLGSAMFLAKTVRADDIQQSLPTVKIHIEGGQDEVNKMNSSPDHSYKCKGTMDLEVPNGFKYVDSDAELASLDNLEMEIRGRGNSTWSEDAIKYPYKIKLKEKESILGMGANRHWALIANAFDPSMMRNRITYWLGHQLGMEYTPYGYPVDVYMEGEYLGSYLLCETIRVAKNRVNIDELTEEDNDLSVITGGYLMSILQDEGSPSAFTTDKGETLQNVTPSFDPEEGGDGDYENDTQKSYIRNYIQEAEYALNEGYMPDETQPSGYRMLDYKDYFDIKSASLYWLIQEFSGNGDAYNTGSTYFYKTRDLDGQKGKIFWGPLWDFDFGWDRNEFDVDDSFSTGMGWMTAMMTDTSEGGLPDQVSKDWLILKEKLEYITRKDGLLDQYYEETKISQAADYDKNHIEEYENYEESVDYLRKWINLRIIWMENRMKELDHYAHKVILKDNPGDLYPQVFYVQHDQYLSGNIKNPDNEDKIFLGWYTEQGEDMYDLRIEEDTIATARFLEHEKAVQPEKIYLRYYDYWVPFSSKEYLINYTILPLNVQDKGIKWVSSNEAIATVEDGETVRFHDKGDVTLTGTFWNGMTASFKLHIHDDNQFQPPSSIKLSQKVLRLNSGDSQQILPIVSPEKASYECSYYSEDEEIAQIDDNGVITARKKGITKVRITVGNYLEEDPVEFMTTCQIIVDNADIISTSVGTSHKVNGSIYKVLSGGTVAFIKAKNAKKVSVPSTVKIGTMTFKVTQINPKAFKEKKIRTITIGKNVKKIKKFAFKGSKATKLIIKTKKLRKAGVKKSLRGSRIRIISVKVGKKSLNKKYVRKYRKIFTRKNVGKRVAVK